MMLRQISRESFFSKLHHVIAVSVIGDVDGIIGEALCAIPDRLLINGRGRGVNLCRGPRMTARGGITS
jgi:hypothetical protein